MQGWWDDPLHVSIMHVADVTKVESLTGIWFAYRQDNEMAALDGENRYSIMAK